MLGLWLQVSSAVGVREGRTELWNRRDSGGMPFPRLLHSSQLAALGAAGLWLDPWSDLVRRKSLSSSHMEPPPCEEHSSPAPPRAERTGSRLSPPERPSPVCSLGAAWQGGMGRETAGEIEDATGGFTRGQCDGIKIAVACAQSLSAAAATRPLVLNSDLRACSLFHREFSPSRFSEPVFQCVQPSIPQSW